MKKHIVLLIGICSIQTYAADPLDQSFFATIRYYKTYDDALNGRVSGTVKVFVGPNTTIYDVQDSLRKELGKGHLRYNSIVLPGELINGRNEGPLLKNFGPEENLDALENDFSFWAFDVEDAQ